MKRKILYSFILSMLPIATVGFLFAHDYSKFNMENINSILTTKINRKNTNTKSPSIDWENNIVNGVQLKDDKNFNNDEQINLRRHFNVYTNSIDDIFDAGETSYIMLKAKDSFFKKIKIHNILIGNDWKWYMNPDNQELILLERQNPQPNLNESNQLEIDYNYIVPPHGAAGLYYYFNYKTNNNFVPPPITSVIESVSISGKQEYTEGDLFDITATPKFSGQDQSQNTSYEWSIVDNNNEELISGQTTNKLTAKANFSWNNKRVICRATYDGKTVTSNEFIVIINQSSVSTDILSVSIKGKSEYKEWELSDITATPTFSAHDQSANTTYQWYIKDDKSEELISGQTTNKLTTKVNLSWNNKRVICKATYNGKVVISNEIIISVIQSDTQILDLYVIGEDQYNDGDFFNIKAIAEFNGENQSDNTTYQWYIKDGANEELIPNQTTYNLKAKVNLKWNNKKVICKAIYKDMEITSSNELEIHVNEIKLSIGLDKNVIILVSVISAIVLAVIVVLVIIIINKVKNKGKIDLFEW